MENQLENKEMEVIEDHESDDEDQAMGSELNDYLRIVNDGDLSKDYKEHLANRLATKAPPKLLLRLVECLCFEKMTLTSFEFHESTGEYKTIHLVWKPVSCVHGDGDQQDTNQKMSGQVPPQEEHSDQVDSLEKGIYYEKLQDYKDEEEDESSLETPNGASASISVIGASEYWICGKCFFTENEPSSNECKSCGNKLYNMTKCPKENCNCQYISDESSTTVVSHINGRHFGTVRSQRLSCDAKNLIYLISCKKCGKQYVGETESWKGRLAGELSKMNPTNTTPRRTPFEKHFYKEPHAKSDVEITVLEKLPFNIADINVQSQKRKKTERKWIRLLDSAYPFGLNDKIAGFGNISTESTIGNKLCATTISSNMSMDMENIFPYLNPYGLPKQILTIAEKICLGDIHVALQHLRQLQKNFEEDIDSKNTSRPFLYLLYQLSDADFLSLFDNIQNNISEGRNVPYANRLCIAAVAKFRGSQEGLGKFRGLHKLFV